MKKVAVSWKILKNGLNFEGTCLNKNCKAYKETIIMNMGLKQTYELGNPNLTNQTSTICPACQSYTMPRSCFFKNCKWKINGIKKTRKGPIIINSDWIFVENKYVRFNKKDSSFLKFSFLKIQTRPGI
ncbi:unnamed protein product [Brachionus calyciflorus]|uniref:Uncharacterized protein n=1 Tax=Brachionus calyciflorus TaxID=104777 RepID=A0A813TW76_9BILA|nr:unnamed protein product [Brachionus calyciflorus]